MKPFQYFWWFNAKQDFLFGLKSSCEKQGTFFLKMYLVIPRFCCCKYHISKSSKLQRKCAKGNNIKSYNLRFAQPKTSLNEVAKVAPFSDDFTASKDKQQLGSLVRLEKKEIASCPLQILYQDHVDPKRPDALEHQSVFIMASSPIMMMLKNDFTREKKLLCQGFYTDNQRGNHALKLSFGGVFWAPF